MTTDPDSHFNMKIPNGIEGPSENYSNSIKIINGSILTRDLDYFQRDRLAKDMLLKEKLKNIARPNRRKSIELTLLRHRGIEALLL